LNLPNDVSQPSRPLLIGAGGSVFLGAVDLSVIATVLPGIVSDFGINTADIDRFIWVVTAYLIAYVAAIPFAGMLADTIGRRRTLLVSLAVFVAGSIVCATAHDLAQLVAGRAIQGAGGGALLPVAIALAGGIPDDRARVQAIGRIAAIDMFGWLIGPTYGALVVHLPSSIADPWRWIFWLNIPLALALALGLLRQRDPELSKTVRPRADWVGAMLLAATITVLSLGITSAGEAGTMTTGLRALGGTPNPVSDYLPVLLSSGVALLALFIARQRLATSPMIPRPLLTRAGGVASLIANTALGTVMMIAVANIPVVVALTEPSREVSIASAILLGVFTGSVVLAALASSRVLPIVRPTGALIVVVLGMALAYPLLDGGEPWRVIPALLLAGLGIGSLLTPLTNAGIIGVERATIGISVSLVLLARLLGMTMGVSALTAVGIHRLQTLTGRLDPVVQESGESTAFYLARQQAFIAERAIPLAVQVVQETFLIGAIIAVIAILPIHRLPRSGRFERGDRVGE
jgi:MFS family permease